MKIEIEKQTGGFIFKYRANGKDIVAVSSGGMRSFFERLRVVLRELGEEPTAPTGSGINKKRLKPDK